MMVFPFKARAPFRISFPNPSGTDYGAKSRPNEKAQRSPGSSSVADARIRGPSFLHRPRIPSCTCGIRRLSQIQETHSGRGTSWAREDLTRRARTEARVGSDAPSSLRIGTR